MKLNILVDIIRLLITEGLLKMKEKNLLPNDILEKGKKLFSDNQMFKGFIYIRENFDKSILSNKDINDILVGEVSVFWENSNDFFLIDKPDYHQKNSIKEVEEKYNNLIEIENTFYESLKEMDYCFFESISPKKFKEEQLYQVSLIKNFMYDCVGYFFYIKDEKVFFLNEINIRGYNPFLNKVLN